MRALRFAIRQLVGSPGYTAIALLTLALGIGVNSSMFSIIDALLFRSLPYPESERIVQIEARTPQGPRSEFSHIELGEIRPAVSSFESLTIINRTQYIVWEPGQPAERINGVQASSELFTTFGLQPMIGRAFSEEETLPGRNQVLVISHRFWQQRYGGSPDVIGRTLRMNGETVTIIGVMPPVFDYRLLWGNSSFWRPLNYTREQMEWRDYRTFSLIGRLNDGATFEQAAAELAPVSAVQSQEHPESYSGLRYQITMLSDTLMDELGHKISWMMLGLAGFILLIACANLANLQLARTTAGIRDLAIRTALGASRRRLIAMQLTECFVLSFSGALLGLVLAWSINRIIENNFLVSGVPALSIHIDTKVLALTLVVALLTGVLFGIAPAWFASRASVTEALKSQSRGSTSGRGQHRMRQALIVAEVALALVLLGGAGIMQRGFARFLEKEIGWDSEQILTATLPVPESKFENYKQRTEYFRAVETKLKELPGVENAAIATSLPIWGYNGQRQILLDGQSPAAATQLPSAFHVMITPDYFSTVGIPLLHGRRFEQTDDSESPAVIIVNESLAQQLWPNESAIGKRIGSMDSGDVYWAEVVGVVSNVEAVGNLGYPSTKFHIYKPMPQEPWGWVYLVIRTDNPGSMVDSMRRAVTLVDPDLPVDAVSTVKQYTDQGFHNLRLAGKTLNWFALLGLTLAAIGIYGVISNLVAQRTSELGIRMALGARPADVLRLILSHGMRLSAVGLLIGLAGAYGLARFLSAAMPRLASPDAIVLGAVALILLVVAAFACWVPARRATKIDPLEALREE